MSGAAGDRHAPTVDCAIVIVTYNSGADIDGLLDSIDAAVGGLSLRTLVVDNARLAARVALALAAREEGRSCGEVPAI